MDRLNKNQKTLRRGMVLGMFVLTLFVILLIYPNIKHFRYSYQMGKPWQYETLYAPFQFPIEKSALQIETEKEQLFRQAIPYYSFNERIGNQQITKAQKDSLLSEKALTLLQTIYMEPILSDDSISSKSKTIYLLKDHVSSELPVSELKTVENIDRYIAHQGISSGMLRILKKYIQPNALYDAEQTEKLNDINNVSIYLGEVQANELIISKGEIVTRQTFRMLESLRSEYTNRIDTSSNLGFVIIGQFLFVLICLSFLYLFLRNYRTDIFETPLYMAFILVGIIVSVMLTRITLSIGGKLDIYLIPYTLFPVILRTFMDSRTAIFSFVSAILLCSFIVPQGYEFLVMQLATGIISVLFLKFLDKRSQLLLTALIIFFSYSALYVALFITSEGKIENIETTIFLRLLLNAIFLTLAYPLLYILEKTFGFLSNVTLLELSNTNNPLLRELSQAAPGTFQHSMQMANLAEEAVMKIGGNPLLVRTGALYHDIGKMNNPMYFTENQPAGISPHVKMSFEDSAKIIISHVTDGIKMAKKNNLPKQLIDFIATHHGRGKTEYFYRSHLKDNPQQKINEAYFSYPGPDPSTIEQAVLMMADACEAATRSLQTKDEKNIKQMVAEIIDFQKEEGRFNNAPITFQDIETVKTIFTTKLCNIYHSRIAYPEKNDTKKEQQSITQL